MTERRSHDITARLDNWSRWATESERRIEVSPTGKMIDRAKIAAGIIEDKTNERRNVDEADAQLIERNMRILLPKYRVILKWHYIKRANRGVVCRKMGIDHRPASIFDDLLRKAHETIEALVNCDSRRKSIDSQQTHP